MTLVIVKGWQCAGTYLLGSMTLTNPSQQNWQQSWQEVSTYASLRGNEGGHLGNTGIMSHGCCRSNIGPSHKNPETSIRLNWVFGHWPVKQLVIAHNGKKKHTKRSFLHYVWLSTHANNMKSVQLKLLLIHLNYFRHSSVKPMKMYTVTIILSLLNQWEANSTQSRHSYSKSLNNAKKTGQMMTISNKS